MIDVVIPFYLQGSRWGNKELKFSLRSLQKHLLEMGDVYLVGEVPSFVEAVRAIQCPDKQGKEQKERNIYRKLLAACETPEVSDPFLMSNDDIFLLKDFKASEFPYYHGGDLVGRFMKRSLYNHYRISVENTLKALMSRGHRTTHFDIHLPMLIYKEKFREVMTSYDWSVKCSYIVKSLYCNSLGIKGEYLMDLKVRQPLKSGNWDKIFNDYKSFSLSDRAIDPLFHKKMLEIFPTPSRFEKKL